MWKSDIGEHKIYAAIVFFKDPQRLNAMGCWQHDIARPFEHLSDGPLKAFLVFYKKDSCCTFSHSGESLVWPDHFSWSIDAWQIDLKGRALIQF